MQPRAHRLPCGGPAGGMSEPSHQVGLRWAGDHGLRKRSSQGQEDPASVPCFSTDSEIWFCMCSVQADQSCHQIRSENCVDGPNERTQTCVQLLRSWGGAPAILSVETDCPQGWTPDPISSSKFDWLITGHAILCRHRAWEAALGHWNPCCWLLETLSEGLWTLPWDVVRRSLDHPSCHFQWKVMH